MIIKDIKTNTSFVKASIPESLRIEYADNHKLIIQQISLSANLSSSSSERVTIQDDKKLVALIFKNENI